MNDESFSAKSKVRQSARGKARIAKGREAEQLAVAYLLQLGYTLVVQNWRCRSGELDAIMRDGEDWVFIEVRSVSDNAGYGTAIEAIHARKQLQVRQLAQRYLFASRLGEVRMRCDAVAITYYSDGRQPGIEHVKHAF